MHKVYTQLQVILFVFKTPPVHAGNNVVLDVQGEIFGRSVPEGSVLNPVLVWDSITKQFKKQYGSYFLSRSNHTGSQAQITIIGLSDSLNNKVKYSDTATMLFNYPRKYNCSKWDRCKRNKNKSFDIRKILHLAV